MRLRRLNSSGIELTRQFLKAVKESNNIDEVVLNGQTFTRSQLITNPSYSSEVSALSDIDLDEARQFETTYDFCEYFDSLIHDHNPQAYREDVGFWTWLAMVYIKQLVKPIRGSIKIGEYARLVLATTGFAGFRRHLLASPFYFYELYDDKELVFVPLFHLMNTPGDLYEFVIGNQRLSNSPVYLKAIKILYFDQSERKIKKKVGGEKENAPGGIRRFVDMVDQFGMTRDFYVSEDAERFIDLLPKEFDKFKK